MSEKSFVIARIGRTVGLHGDLKLNLLTDFPEQFEKGALFRSDRGELEIISYNPSRNLVRFRGYESLEDAKRLTNCKLYSSERESRSKCKLADGEYFWFDLIGMELYDGERLLGKVSEIQRLQESDYLHIETQTQLVAQSLPKSFLVPYIPRYILSVDTEAGKIHTTGTFDILEAS
jgi:16S rRNA processing protein RimM